MPRVYAYLRRHAKKEVDKRGLEKQLMKCLIDYAVGTLPIRARDGHKEFYARLNGKERFQFTRAMKEPPTDEYVDVICVDVPPSCKAKVLDGQGLHISLIYTSDEGNKLNKALR